jgi:hypothetical protein
MNRKSADSQHMPRKTEILTFYPPEAIPRPSPTYTLNTFDFTAHREYPNARTHPLLALTPSSSRNTPETAARSTATKLRHDRLLSGEPKNLAGTIMVLPLQVQDSPSFTIVS